MRRGGIYSHFVAGFVVFMALLTASLSPAAAQGSASLTIHSRICPVEYSGDDIFGDCHGNPPASSLEFAIAGPITATAATDAAGNLVFGGLPAGVYDVAGGETAGAAGVYVYCSANDDPYNVVPVTWTDTGVAIEVMEGAAVLCDWYNIPYAPPDDGGEAAGDDPPEEPADEPAPLVSVWLEAYNCDTDPGAQDPAVVCDPAPGVTVEAAQDGESLGSVATNDAGGAMIEAEEGSTVTLTEDMGTVPPGYLPLSGGVRTFESVAGGEFALFVHVRVGDQQAGRLQVVNGSCPTSEDEPRTEFTVVGPPVSGGASATPCEPTNEAPFTISGRLLGGDLSVVTGGDGAWRGTLPAGTYTVTDDSGASVSVDVIAGETTVVTAIDYVPAPDGTLIVSKVRCTEGEEAGTTITIDDAANEDDSSCTPSDGEFRLAEVAEGDGTAVAVEVFALGPGGQAELTLRTGDYRLTDLASGETATFTIGDGTTTAVTVRHVVVP
jgi:hypothetical protein